jgi:hypothetical protein
MTLSTQSILPLCSNQNALAYSSHQDLSNIHLSIYVSTLSLCTYPYRHLCIPASYGAHMRSTQLAVDTTSEQSAFGCRICAHGFCRASPLHAAALQGDAAAFAHLIKNATHADASDRYGCSRRESARAERLLSIHTLSSSALQRLRSIRNVECAPHASLLTKIASSRHCPVHLTSSANMLVRQHLACLAVTAVLRTLLQAPHVSPGRVLSAAGSRCSLAPMPMERSR